jgi:hypothetical protein
MTTSISKIPKRTTFVVKDKRHGIIPLNFWCKENGIKYNTVQARAWRAGLSGNAIGLVELDPYGEHREIFKKVRLNNGAKA